MTAVDPRPLGLTEVRQAWHELSDPSRPPVDAADARQVVAILASSRGGSSWFHQLLRGTGRFVSLEGEHAPLYRLNGMFAETERQAHDGQLDHGDERRQAFTGALGSQLTVPRPREADEQAAVRRFCRLLWLQWGAVLPEPDRLRAIVTGCVHAGRPGEHEASLLLRVLRVLREVGHPVQPWYYDLPPALVRAAFPRLEQPAGPPPSGVVAEEPPFVVPTLARAAGRDDLRRYPLLLKASVDAYRIVDLPKLFPVARITHVHLVRNPAASINGLMDGWLHRGFFSRRVPGHLPLDIAGYSHLPWGRRWWNFDLPPGWAGTRGQPLPAVCGHQWASAHEAILAARPARTLRLAVEDIQRDNYAAVATVLAAVGERDWRPNAPARAPSSCRRCPLLRRGGAPAGRCWPTCSPPAGSGRWRRLSAMDRSHTMAGAERAAAVDDRKVLCGILFVLYTGIRWEWLPGELGFGCGMTCWRRLRDWNNAGVWQRLHEVLLAELRAAGKLDMSRAVVDSSHIERSRAAQTGRGPVDRGRPGSKHHLITDAGGVPLAVLLTGGNRNDVTQLIPLLQAVPPIRGKRGRPCQRAPQVYADRGYDHDKYRAQVRELGITPVIARRGTDHGSGLGKMRWVVEQSFALLHWFRRLRIRWEIRDDIHEALLKLGCALICWRRLRSSKS